MMPSAIALEGYLADVLADPRAHLKPGEITLLRKLGTAGVAMKARGGWVIAGAWYRVTAFRRFAQLDLTDEAFTAQGSHLLRLNHRGRNVFATLSQRRRK